MSALEAELKEKLSQLNEVGWNTSNIITVKQMSWGSFQLSSVITSCINLCFPCVFKWHLSDPCQEEDHVFWRRFNNNDWLHDVAMVWEDGDDGAEAVCFYLLFITFIKCTSNRERYNMLWLWYFTYHLVSSKQKIILSHEEMNITFWHTVWWFKMMIRNSKSC